jgi:hypothetical protein
MSNTEVTIIVLALSFVIIALGLYLSFGRKKVEEHH